MKAYSTYWRTTIFASIVFHLLTWLGAVYLLPHLMPEPRLEIVQEMDWIDVDLSEPEPVVISEEAIPIEEAASEPEEVYSEFDFPPLVIPDLPPIETPVLEPPPPPPPPTPKIETPPPPLPSKASIAKDEGEAEKKLDEALKKDDAENSEIVVAKGKQQLGEPPITLSEAYPPKGGGLNYGGYVSVAATIGKDGMVKKTKIMRTSGRMMVDQIAMTAAAKWTFKPALDQEGKPMECDKIITFNFKNFL